MWKVSLIPFILLKLLVLIYIFEINKIYDMQDFNKTEGLSLFIDSPFNSVLVDPLNKSH